ncbi:MAG: 4Fe-4S binding protein, partial [Desulfohalobiaceae bacterium]|nr:4Fe-4S binding protein [Desulfohalobiaceae bacterium]
MPSVWIDYELCDGCGLCAKKCPYDAIAMRDGVPHILEQCTCCCLCLEVCKKGALQTDITPKAVPDFSGWKGVWVFAEHAQNTLQP